jgi:hypothetical protein
MPRLTQAAPALFLCALSIALPAMAQTAAPAVPREPRPSPCLDAAAHPEWRQLDYWVGEWEVFSADGKKSSDVSVTKVVNTCGLQEVWKAARGSTGDGLGLSTYNQRTNKWEYFWVSGAGATSHFDGTLQPDGMHFRLVQPMPGGALRLRHWTLIKRPDGKIDELSMGSDDDGVTWKQEYLLTWVPKK